MLNFTLVDFSGHCKHEKSDQSWWFQLAIGRGMIVIADHRDLIGIGQNGVESTNQIGKRIKNIIWFGKC